MSFPPPPQYTGAPGQQQLDGVTSNGQANPSHMPPPPLPPVVIPQNTNPIPTAMTSPGGTGVSSALSPSPGSGGGSVRRAAPEPNKRALYVGGLDPRVTEDVLRQIFETTGHVQNVKIIPDKNMGAVSEIYTPFNTIRGISSEFSVFIAKPLCRCCEQVFRFGGRASVGSKRDTHSCLFPRSNLSPPQHLHLHSRVPSQPATQLLPC